ncbi:methionine ABC transporter permease [Vagococcus carniphilus]|uniref:ABC transporter permease n=1 Tax=Vagococcus carniphilus TaxID=218144 RepID=A0AAW8UE80_9ENTE|nr:methionine ABC transporter permease [Vagococcus carniphilus]MDT2815693.1 ABC transporter permease [Vagococcus carniphilus]MDT2831244.1 ABC transporter permease [Vagococcus carniphilus]MDT2835270.1 ABC transporter permease [Vagococcus carniphilus]MDT2839597.1 ABC transporter permease [Vagococcus carniphilus]MDT2854066.1 ABC transporter permease [Vagococcus carniphilus]
MSGITYYLPEMFKALKETGIMLGISVSLGLVGGLLIGIALYLYRPEGIKPNKSLMLFLNGYVNITRSFPFLLLVVAVIPLTRFIFNTAFGPVAASFPLSLVAIAIFGRLVEQVLLDVPKEVVELANALGATKRQFVCHFLLKESRSGLILSFTSMIISLMSYSTVMGVVGGGGIGDFAIRFGYQRYEYEIMYATIVIMIIIVGSIQLLGTYVSKKLDKRK